VVTTKAVKFEEHPKTNKTQQESPTGFYLL